MAKWGDLLKEAEEVGGFDPLPSGTYDVQVVKSTHKVAQSGKSMFEVQFKVLSGPHANRIVWNRYVVTPENPKALGYFFSNMRCLGLTTEFFAAQPGDDQVAAALENAYAKIEVTQSEYNGAIRNEVKKTMAAEGGIVAAATAPANSAVPNLPTAAPSAPVAPAAPF